MGATTLKRAAATLALLMVSSWARGESVPCGSIKCENDSVCIQDSPNFEDHVLPDGSTLDIHSTNTDTHCACPPGWTGVSCDIRYHACDGSSHKCYHGGECVLGLIDKYDNEQLYCNCDMAQDEEGNRYVGKYCEQQSMIYCGDDLSRFCLNNGVCNSEYPLAGKSCMCQDGFEGEFCEYKVDTVPDCTLDCQNGGHCKLGTPHEPSMDYFNVSGKAAESFQYCDCGDMPGKYHGEFCEITSEKCGEDQCYHGSKCVESVVNGETLHHCDCRYANTDSVSYAGRFCQYEATEYCDKGDSGINGHLFCVNNGQCQKDYYLGCTCPAGYRGFSCEYYVDENASDKPHVPPPDDVEDTICSLHCNGHGTCRNGIKEKPLDEVVGDATHLNGDEALSNDYHEHCVCEEGFVGLQCEHKADECGGGQYHCFHGGQCYTGGDEQKCDCSTANSTELGTSHFAGDMCEHPATEICIEGSEVHKYNPSKGLSFCVNYGTCKAKVKEGEPHPGCDCEEGKWTGPHCEIKIAQQPVSGPTAIKNESDDDGGKGFRVISAIVAVIAVVGIVGFVAKQFLDSHRTRKRHLDKNALHWESSRSLGGYRDEPINEVNLSPRRESTTGPKESGIKRTPAPSSRDPFASHLVVPPSPVSTLNAAVADDSGPQVYLGPPQDEDGHVLHSVDII
eukprot:CAMPEP_0172440214 /NCGR_PEP_ID=MMETSP1065-20121228/922_1 /TAXON_ID=265537 /ORGANISM="Amphiprora paludosa, Strain CCMP125" /LENGTH=675 /DNA_ID=CAMNT_0013188999 /DNA_START=26 /DNA_END=2053 /DNA_ORIENTATION=-